MTSFQPLRHQNQTCPVVDEQLHPVRAARAEHEDVAGERVQAQRDLHQGRQTIHAAAKIDRRRPDQHPDPRRRRDHRPSAASTRRKAAPSTSRPTRTLTPSGRAISMRISSPTGAAPPSSRSGTSAISTGRKCAAVSAGAGRPCRSSRQAHQPNVLRDNPCAAQYSPRLWPLARPASRASAPCPPPPPPDPASTPLPAPLPAPSSPPLFARVRTEITQPSAREATWGRDVAYCQTSSGSAQPPPECPDFCPRYDVVEQVIERHQEVKN